jgi:hypothetical protein
MGFQPVSADDERIEHLPRLERSIFFGGDHSNSHSPLGDYRYLRVDPLKFDIARISTSSVEAKDCRFPKSILRYVAGVQVKNGSHFLICLSEFFQEHSGSYRVKGSDVTLVDLDSVINYESLRAR